MATTRSLIAKYIVPNTSTGSFTMSSISQSYTDLEIFVTLNYAVSTSANNWQLKVNSSTTAADYGTEYLVYFYNNAISSATNSGNAYFYFQYTHGADGGATGVKGITRFIVPRYTEAIYHNFANTTSAVGDTLGKSIHGVCQKQFKKAEAITSLTFDAGGGAWQKDTSVHIYGLLHS